MIDPDEIAELRQQIALERRRLLHWFAHPDPRDPDHPWDESVPQEQPVENPQESP